MSTGDFSNLDGMIARIRAFPDVGAKAAPAVAEVLAAQLAATVGAGTTPDGEAWRPTLKGEKPKLGSKIDSVAVGSTVTVRLRGKSFLHHTGIARGHIRRQVIPTNDLPAPMIKAVEDVVAGVVKAHFDG